MKIEYRRKLPHKYYLGAMFFITWNLEGAIPEEVRLRLEKEHAERKRRINSNLDLSSDEKSAALDLARSIWIQGYDDALDELHASSPTWLKQPEIAKIVVDRLHEYDGLYYRLGTYVVMPNHVHCLLDFSIQLPNDDREISDANYKQVHKVINLIKGGTARWCNQTLHRSGTFWQQGCFDRYIRDDKHRFNVTQYILNNPVKAGLCKTGEIHPFTYLSTEDAQWRSWFLNG